MIIAKADRLDKVGEYFFSRKLREVAELRARGREIINLGIGSPDLPPSPQTVAALELAASDPRSHGYQPYNGTPELRTAFAQWYKRLYQVDLEADAQILPLLGSKEGIFHISQAFLNPGDQVLVPDPGYPSYAAVTRLVGASPVFYDLTEETGWFADLRALAREDLSRVKLMWVNYPHMPTGAVARQADFERLIDFSLAHEILMCHDMPYSLILNGAPPLSILRCPNAFACCLELNSLSKSHHMAGWRIGMVAGASEYIQAILTIKSNMDSGMFLPVQKAAVAALKNSEAWHRAQSQIYRRRRQLACALMDALDCSYVPDRPGLFVWARVPQQVDDVMSFLDQLLYEAGVFLAPGIIFGRNGERYIRTSLCAEESRIEEAIRRIRSFIEGKP